MKRTDLRLDLVDSSLDFWRHVKRGMEKKKSDCLVREKNLNGNAFRACYVGHSSHIISYNGSFADGYYIAESSV